jgi:hypothetical protein
MTGELMPLARRRERKKTLAVTPNPSPNEEAPWKGRAYTGG